MSIHADDLRDIANNHGWPVCELAADEIEELERANATLSAENEKLKLALTSPVAPEQVVAAVQRIDSIAFTKIAARHLPGDMDPHDAWLFFQEASRAFFGKEIV